MSRHRLFPILLLALPLFAADDDKVFRSDVSLVRVDAQVLDVNRRAITGLHQEDFVLKEGGKVREIRNFANEDMPIDLLFLIDVSGSMRPHVERIAEASRQAMRIMNEKDRVAIMVFDTYTRIRMPFRGVSEVDREFQSLLRQENFRGGTEITRSLIQAANYIQKNGRKDARRAIVILTDDETGGDRDEAAVGRALNDAQAVLSALIAPDAMAGRQGGYPGGGGQRRRGGGFPGGNGGGGGGLGGIILGGPLGGPRMPTGGGQGGGQGGQGQIGRGGRTKPAGTSEIARESGGDSLQVDDASALEETLNRIRQRYTLYFYLGEGVQPGQERSIEVTLADNARRRYADSTVRYRRIYSGANGGASDYGGDERPTISRTPHQQPGQLPPRSTEPPAAGPSDSENTVSSRSSSRRRAAISEPDGPRGVTPAQSNTQEPDAPATAPAPATANPAPAAPAGGWRVLKPGEKP